MITQIESSEFPNSIMTPDGQLAWKASGLPSVMEILMSNQWLVLGGDVLTIQGNYTHDSWFYDPIPSISLLENIQNSIKVMMEYVNKYILLNGDDYLFSLVLSDAFISGK